MAFDLLDLMPASWRELLSPHLDLGTVAALSEFVDAEYHAQTVYPPLPDLFAAYRLAEPSTTRVLILGQDPYHRPGQAHGLSFSVPAGVTVPPSLRNVFCELRDDLGVIPQRSGDLTRWAEQGVLLLNAVLTVRRGQPTSHAGKGWEHVTDATIKALAGLEHQVVFVLWGGYARRKAGLISSARHTVLQAGHPSPMNPSGFRGCRHFSKINSALVEAGSTAIHWD